MYKVFTIMEYKKKELFEEWLNNSKELKGLELVTAWNQNYEQWLIFKEMSSIVK